VVKCIATFFSKLERDEFNEEFNKAVEMVKESQTKNDQSPSPISKKEEAKAEVEVEEKENIEIVNIDVQDQKESKEEKNYPIQSVN
jgi:hypothetical protein